MTSNKNDIKPICRTPIKKLIESPENNPLLILRQLDLFKFMLAYLRLTVQYAVNYDKDITTSFERITEALDKVATCRLPSLPAISTTILEEPTTPLTTFSFSFPTESPDDIANNLDVSPLVFSPFH